MSEADKQYQVNSNDLITVADAIRLRTGQTRDLIFPDEFVVGINSIAGTWRPIHANGIEILSTDPASGFLNLKIASGSVNILGITATDASGGKNAEVSIRTNSTYFSSDATNGLSLATSWLTTIVTNPMQSANDLIVGGANGAPTRLAGGTAGQVLGVDSNGNIGWVSEAHTGTVTSVTITQGTGITVSDSGVAITTTGNRTISLNAATTSALGGVRVGEGLSITAAGVLALDSTAADDGDVLIRGTDGFEWTGQYTAYNTASIPWGKVDTTSTSTLFTATVPGVSAYRNGVSFWLKNGVVTSASGFTININGLGAKKVYSNMAPTTRDTTLFNINYTMLFVYDAALDEGNGAFVCYRGYDANTNTIGYQVRSNSSSLVAQAKFYRYRLLFTSADGTKWVPANTSTSTNSTARRDTTQVPIDPFGPIVWYGTTTAIEANAVVTPAQLWQQYYGSYTLIGYSFNRTNAAATMTANLPIYIKCAPQADGSAIIDADTPYVQSLPTTDDGKIYIFLGRAVSATAFEILINHPVYAHVNGKIQLWTPYAVTAGYATNAGSTGFASQATDAQYLNDGDTTRLSVGSLTNPVYFTNGVPAACTYSLHATVPANAIFTDTTYMLGWSTDTGHNDQLKLTPSSGTAQYVTIGYATRASSASSALQAVDAQYLNDGDATRLDVGSTTNPTYFSGGLPVACTYSLNKTVPSDAVFTDTTYILGWSSDSGHTNQLKVTPSSGSVQYITIGYATRASTADSASQATDAQYLNDGDATRLSVGSTTKPVYFSDGVPVACTYSLNATVPSNAVFTDTTYTLGWSSDAGHNNQLKLTPSIGTAQYVTVGYATNASSASSALQAVDAQYLNDGDATRIGAGSATNPVYFSGGLPVACTYSLNKTVPSDAVFTDTTYTLGWSTDSGHNNQLKLTPSSGTAQYVTVGYATSASSASTALQAVDAQYLNDGDTTRLGVGSATNPVYFANGLPVSCTYSLNKTVPADAVFTDTTYTLAWSNDSGHNNQLKLTPSSGTAQYVTVGYATNASSASSALQATDAQYLNDGDATRLDVGSATSPVYFSGGLPVACTYSLHKTVPSDAVFTDTKVTQTATTTNAAYEVLFSATADNTTRTEGAGKNSNLLFNPSTGNLQTTQLNGVTIGSSPKFTDTTYILGWSTESGHNNQLKLTPSVGAAQYVTIGYATNASSASSALQAVDAQYLNDGDATRLAVGSTTNPVYFANGVPAACTYSLNKTVPSDAVFTDTTYTLSWSVESGHNNQLKLTPSSGTAQYVTISYATNASSAGAALQAVDAQYLNDGDATRLAVGSVTQPVYFSDGVPVSCTYSLNKTVPSDAIFTDTTYTLGWSTDAGHNNQLKLTPSVGTAQYVTVSYATNASSASSALQAVDAQYLNDGDATRLAVGSATNPVYFTNGVPVACTYSLNKTVPADAVFTDTTYTLTHPTNTNNLVLSANGTAQNTITLGANAWNSTAIPTPAASASAVATTAAAGSATTYSRGDHVHSISLGSGTSNGQVKIAGQDITVTGWSSKLDAPSSSGEAGQVLKLADSSGNVTWANDNNTLYTLSWSTESGHYNQLKLTPSSGTAQYVTIGYATSASSASTALQAVDAQYLNDGDATRLSVGSVTNPVYFSGGLPVACTYSLNKTVPSDAVFTDTTYTLGWSTDSGHANQLKLTPSSGAVQYVTVGYATNAGTASSASSVAWANVTGHNAGVDDDLGISDEMGDATKFLNQKGGWSTPSDNNTTYTLSWSTDSGHNNQLKLTPSVGTAQYVTVSYATNASSASSALQAVDAQYLNDGDATRLAVGSATNPVYFSGGLPVACTYSLNKTVPSDAVFTDAKVTQTATTTSASYELLFSATADNTTRTEGARKSNNLLFNPSTGNLQTTQLNGVTIGSSPKFTDTTYTLGWSTDSGHNNQLKLTPSSGSVQYVTVGYATSASSASTALQATDAQYLNDGDATRLGAGSTTNPVYFSGGLPVACTYSLNKTVPSNAVFTDTTYTAGWSTESGHYNQLKLTPSSGTAQYVTIGYATSASSASTALQATDAQYLNDGDTTRLEAGSASRPVYFTGGLPTACTYRMAATNVAATTARAITTDLETGIWYVNGTNSTDLYSQADGVVYANQYNTSWITEIYQDYRTGQLAVRGKNNGTWQAWRKILDTSNFTTLMGNYLPLSGGTLTNSQTTTAILNINSTASNAEPHVLADFMAPNLSAGSTGSYSAAWFRFGVAASTYQSACLAFHYAGTSSQLNYLGLGVYGIDWILNINGRRRVGINTTSPISDLDVAGGISWSSKATSQYNATDDCIEFVFV